MITDSDPISSNDAFANVDGNVLSPLVVPKSSQPVAHQETDGPSELMSRTRRLNPYLWSTATSPFATTVVPVVTELMDSLSSLCLYNNFAYVSYDSISLRVTPNTTRFFRGLLGFTFVPDERLTRPYAYTPSALSSLPTTYIDASSSETATISLPWSFPLGKVRPQDLPLMGHVVIWVADRLAGELVPGTTQILPVALEAQFVGFKFFDPSSPVSLCPVVSRTNASAAPGAFANAEGAGDDVSREAAAKSKSGVLSTTLDSLSGIASAASSIPAAAPFTGPVAMLTSGLSTVLKSFGFSKPPSEIAPAPYYPAGDMFFNSPSGLLPTNALSPDPNFLVSTDPRFLAETDDKTSLAALAGRKILIRSLSTVTTPISGPTLLGTIPVRPGYCWKNNTARQYSGVSQVSRTFRSWSGDLQFDFVVPASSMTRMRFIITYSPTRPVSYSESNRFAVLEVSGTTSLTGVVPWTSRFPYLDLPTASHNYNDDQANGFISVYQATDMISSDPSAPPAPLSVLVFCRGTEDLTFCRFQDAVRWPALLKRTLAQGFVGLADTVKYDRLLAECNVKSIREIAHLRHYLGDFTVTSTAGATFGGVNPPDTIAYWLESFCYFRGSVNYHLYAADRSSPSTMHVELPLQTSGTFVKWYVETPSPLVVSVPYTHTDGYNRKSYILPAVSVFHNGGLASLTFSVYVSYGDDLSLGGLIPSLAFV